MFLIIFRAKRNQSRARKQAELTVRYKFSALRAPAASMANKTVAAPGENAGAGVTLRPGGTAKIHKAPQESFVFLNVFAPCDSRRFCQELKNFDFQSHSRHHRSQLIAMTSANLPHTTGPNTFFKFEQEETEQTEKDKKTIPVPQSYNGNDAITFMTDNEV